MGKIAEQALPLVRNVIEAVIYAVFPFVFLLFLLAQGRGLGMAIKSFVMSLVWIQLWPPLYAILNYVSTLASAKTLAAAARMSATSQGLALDTAASIYHGAISDQAVTGYMVISIPIIATAIIRGGEVAFQAVTGVGSIQSAASGEASSASKGNISQDAVSIDQQQLAPTKTSPFMSSASDARGTTIQGIGADAGAFRYQATLSRLATTFTFTERQATSLAESAREAESLAKTEREATLRSHTAALTRALGIQETFERSMLQSGGSNTAESASISSQFQALSSVSKDVNRRLGLAEESTVGKSIAAAASVGVKVPFTEIGGLARAEGRSVDQQQLHSAYDYARKAIETAQISDSQSLVKEFRSSSAYQWARGNRTSGTSGFDSSYREATEHQASSDRAHGQARELSRAAQFMREWSSGAQTDFTNYAVRRLADRSQLTEEDPLKLQRAVTEIAYAYAKGGNLGESGFAPVDSPLLPSTPLMGVLAWPAQPLSGEFGVAPASTRAINDDWARNDEAVRNMQKQKNVGAKHDRDTLGAETQSAQRRIGTNIENRRTEVTHSAGSLSVDYNSTVAVEKINEHHGGNRAVWDTVGAQTDNRAKLGSPPPPAPARPPGNDKVP
jgi:conjugal transfer mating pair stabilization protein TraG